MVFNLYCGMQYNMINYHQEIMAILDYVSRTIADLQINVQRVVGTISDETLHAVVDHMQEFLEMCLSRGGHHMGISPTGMFTKLSQ